VRTPTDKKKGIHCFCLHNFYYKLIRRAKKIISLHLLKQQMSKAWILVGIGGLLGSISRYAMASFITNTFPYSFPIGTWTIGWCPHQPKLNKQTTYQAKNIYLQFDLTVGEDTNR
jgi:hypothetical protein